jgi:hypothetical protein
VVEPPAEAPPRDLSRYEALSADDFRTSEAAKWKRLAVPTITIHLTELDDKDPAGGFHKALAMVPVCPNLLDAWSDPNDLIAAIAKTARDRYLATARGQWVLAHGEVSPLTFTHHKRSEQELGGHRYVVAACAADRPAFVVTCQLEGARVRELLHFYVAQGLAKQFPDQRALLARTADFEMAHEVMRVAGEMLDITRFAIRPIARDPELGAKLLQVWSSRCCPPVIARSRLLQLQESLLTLDPRDGRVTFSRLREWLVVLDKEDKEWTALVDEVGALVNRAEASGGTTCERGPEPQVTYQYEAWACQTPPAEILLPEVFPGRILWGGYPVTCST